MVFWKKKKEKKTTIGGLPFLLTLLCLIYLSLGNIIHLTALLQTSNLRPPSAPSLSSNWFYFLVGCSFGAWVAHILIKGHSSVFIHELKHKIVSGLVGNKVRGLKVGSDSGHFKYAYEKRNEKYNSFISLAPYFLPLFTFLGALLACGAYKQGLHIVLILVGLGYGCDLLLNLRDISPIQTDLTDITGGYNVALLFLLTMNVTIFTMLAAWVSDGFEGLQILLAGHWNFLIRIVAYYRGLQLSS